MKYKALMLDVDGTLVFDFNEGITSKRLLDSLERATKKLHVGFATGRPPYLMQKILKQVPFNGPSIFGGGGIILDLPSQKELYVKNISEQDARKIAKYLIKNKIKFFVNLGGRDEEYSPSLDLSEVVDMYTALLPIEKTDTIIEDLSHIATVSLHKAHVANHKGYGVHITHAEATKLHGIFEVAKYLGIGAHEIIGVGDGYNDFPLLMACGLKIAMGNAVPELKEIADYIAPSVDEDGVAHVIEKFILPK